MRIVVALVLASVLSACQGPISPAVDAGGREPAPAVVVERIEMMMAQSFPVQVRLRIEGHLTKACALADPAVELRGDTFFIALRASDTAGSDCPERQSFSRSLSLPAHGLKKGTYKVVAGDRETSFTLTQDNVLERPEPSSLTR